MNIDIITIFPDMFKNVFDESIIGKAQQNNLVNIKIHNLRDYSTDKHHKIDDKPYGGGSGMVFKVEPIYKAINTIKKASKVKKKILK